MKKVRRDWDKRFKVPEPTSREVLKFHAQQGVEMRVGNLGKWSGAFNRKLGLYTEDLLRLWIALSGFQPQDLELLLERYGFTECGPQTFEGIARAWGCSERTIRKKLKRIEAKLKERLLKRP